MNQLFVLLGIESWKPYLSALLLPPLPLLLLLLVGARLILPRRGLGWTLVLLSTVLLWLSGTVGASHLLARALLKPPAALSMAQVAEIKAQVQARQPVAIVVLGGGSVPLAPEYGVSNLLDRSVERLRYGLWLARQTGAPVAFSGGVGRGLEGGAPEAQIAARIASQEFGLPLKWLEERSRDTRENAAYSVALLKPLGITHVVLVTHDYHMPRASRAFQEAAQGAIRIETAPLGTIALPSLDLLAWLPSGRGFDEMRLVLHEALGRLLGA